MGRDALTDRCGGGGGATKPDGGGSITNAGRVGGGGEVDVVVGFRMGRGHVVRAAVGGGSGDITAAL